MPRTFTTRPYSKVVRDMWGDDRFNKLTPVRPSGQDLWLYLLTGPHCNVIPGLFVNMGFGTLADRLKWSAADVKRFWQEIADLKMAEADWAAGVIWLPNSFRHNEPANPNVVTSWRNVPLPQCDLVRRALVSLRQRLCPMEVDRIKKAKKADKDPTQTLGWVQAFDGVFAKSFPEAVMVGLPEEMAEASPESFGEGFPQLFGDTLGSTGSVTGTGSGSNSPLTPRRAGGISLRRPSVEERKYAEAVLSVSRCTHEPKCESRAECIGRIVYVKRHNEVAGMLVEAAS